MEKNNIKKAIITGSGRGIGRQMAIELASEGIFVFVHYAGNDEQANITKNMIESAGGKCALIKKNLCDEDCAYYIYSQTGDVDILIHNASVQYRKKWAEITEEEFCDQINCNLKAPLFLTQKYVPHMKEQGWGRIISVGSVQEKKPHDDMLVYSSSKCALTGMMRSLSLQLCGTGITVNSIAPGVIATDRNAESLADDKYRSVVLSKIPMNRAGDASEFRGIVRLLCSDDASYITGQNIFVDGGMGIK